MSPKVTRRQLAAGLAASGALMAQAPPPPLPQNPDEELQAARNQLRLNSEALAKVKIPVTAEPAAHFKAI